MLPSSILLPLAFALWQAASPEIPDPAAVRQPEPAPARYRTLSEVVELFERWTRERPESVAPVVLGESHGGRPVPAVTIGRPGDPALDERPTVVLLGGLDGVSLAGSEAVVEIASTLVTDVSVLPATVSIVAVPWASPDALSGWVEGRGPSGLNARPDDADGDGRVDEDPPDDLDGDGRILELLIEDPAGEWVRSRDARFLRRAREGEAPRFRLRREGRDDDGDGAYNEDPLGGVELDLNFPTGWSGPWEDAGSGIVRGGGAWPLSERLARALADLVIARRTVAVLAFQGHHGWAAAPGGTRAPGEPALVRGGHAVLFERWSARFGEHTGRAQKSVVPLAGARGAARPGAAIDWCYAVAGALAFEIAPWGPHLGRRSPEAVDAVFRERAVVLGREAGDDRSRADAAWGNWLDDEHGGIGFVDWTPVDLPGGGKGLVGGWAERTRFNPPPEQLAAARAGLFELVVDLAESVPVLEIDVRAAERDGEVCRLRALVRNRGGLPTGIAPRGSYGRPGAVLELELPPDARLLTGAARVALAHVPPQGRSAEVEWLLVLPSGAACALVARDDWALPVRREVRL